MQEIVFENQSPIVASAPVRTDIACFVGFIARRTGVPLPPPLREWLRARGWTAKPYGRPEAEIEALQDLPVPIDSWDVFDRLYAWEQRANGTTYLGAAVRSFFAQGGRKCYVIRVADPLPLSAMRAERIQALDRVLPGCSMRRLSVSAVDRASWRGVGHLFGLPDVSFLCLPDLPETFAVDPSPPTALPIPVPPPEDFVECSAELSAPVVDTPIRRYRAPRCDDAGFVDWGRAVRVLTDLIAGQLREIQLVVSIPLPELGSAAARDLVRTLVHDVEPSVGALLGSAFVQLSYPWLRTAGSGRLPESIEPPDAALIGVLARNALMRGTFRSAASLPLAGVVEFFPRLRPEDLVQARRRGAQPENLIDAVSLLGPTPRGPAVLSDVTTSGSQSYRPAGVNRLTSVIVRAARQLGEDLVFEASGERVWARLREGLELVLADLWHGGALSGQTADEAFTVRCDRSTMTQNDIDAGRMVAKVVFNAAAPVEQIIVALAIDEGGQVSLIANDGSEQEAA